MGKTPPKREKAEIGKWRVEKPLKNVGSKSYKFAWVSFDQHQKLKYHRRCSWYTIRDQ